jgi:hypothetical protein
LILGKEGFPDRKMLFGLLGLSREDVADALGLGKQDPDGGGTVADRLARVTTSRKLIEASAEDVQFMGAEEDPAGEEDAETDESDYQIGEPDGEEDEEAQETVDYDALG